MVIAIDGRPLTGRYTGDRTYWRNLLRTLARLYPEDAFCVYSRVPVEPGELPDFSNLTYHVVPAANDRVWTLAAFPRALRERRPDIAHVQYTVPPACPCPVVTTIHDISFRLFPQWFPLKDRLLLNGTIPGSIRRAASVITDSDSSREDMLRAYRVSAEKIVSIPLGLPPEFAAYTAKSSAVTGAEKESRLRTVKQRYNLDAPFALAVGVLQPRKNLRVLAEAFGRAKAARDLPHQLVLAGKAGWDTEQDALRQAARQGGGEAAAQAVVFPGYVADADLPALYQACDAFAYPSLYEGFGLPPLEAMACSAPTLVSDAPPMPHNVGQAALVVPAKDVAAWADALGRVLTDVALRSQLAANGPVRAMQFTWETTAQQTRRVYEEALKS